MTNRSGTVFVVDDDAAVRKSLARLLGAAGLAVETYPSSQAFLAAYEPARRGCLVLDLQLRDESGQGLIDELAARGATLPVIVLTAHGSVPASVRALKSGAIDFLEKPAPPGELTARVREAVLLDERRREMRNDQTLLTDRLARLTPREREVAALVVKGKSSKAIAASLGVSVRTVEGHRGKLLEKMQAGSATELVATLLRTGQFSAA